MKRLLFVAAVLVGTAAHASDKFLQTVTSTATVPGLSTPLSVGGAYSVQCNVRTYVRATSNYLNGAFITADGGRPYSDGGFQTLSDGGYSDLASSTSLVLPAGTLFPMDLIGSENGISFLSVSGSSTCRIYGRNPKLSSVIPGDSVSGGTSTATGADGGSPYVQPAPGHWDCARTPVGICTSTGPTNHGSMTFTPGSYLVGYCSAAAYVGNAAVNDGGSPASCASRDGGAVFNEACQIVTASGMVYRDYRDTTSNVLGCTSVSGTSVCSFSACVN